MLLSLPVIVISILHIRTKHGAAKQELLFGCNVSMIVLAFALFFGLDWITGVSTLFLISVGIPAYSLLLSEQRRAKLTSFLVHVIPPLMGYLQVRQVGLPDLAWFWAFFFFVIILHTITFYTTDPAQNINMVHSPWPPVRSFFADKMPLYRFCNALLCLAFLLAGDYLLRTILRDAV